VWGVRREEERGAHSHRAVKLVFFNPAPPPLTDFDGRHPVAAPLQQDADAGGGDALAQPADHTAGDEHVAHGVCVGGVCVSGLLSSARETEV